MSKKIPQSLNANTILCSMNVYRKFIRLSYQFPKQLQNKIRFNTREAFTLNKVFLDQGSFNQKNIKSLLDKSNKLHNSISSLSNSNKALFLELFGDNLN